MLLFIISLLGAGALFIETTRMGMPIRRWVVIGAIIGPLAWCLLRVHYRRAFMRSQDSTICQWLP
ncbi:MULTISPECIES: hypothetical protein [Pseudoalteromonas]|uniref:hypothetical protein n=1 Tax=Pseudoalteromonas TaxID=53246 RepID=UPI0017881138|nr:MULTISPECIES: hypothetical protein [Pseudoalteromonas]